MAELTGLSNAHIILLAVHLCINSDVSAIPHLRLQSQVNVDVFLRIILTFLPESIEPSRYISVLENLVEHSVPQADGGVSIDTSPVNELSEAAARKRVRKLHLLPLQCPGQHHDNSESPFVQFLIHRAHRIDLETGIQPYILELLDHFVHVAGHIRLWLISTILPVLRFNYEYHTHDGVTLFLEVAQSLDARSAVNTFLSKTRPREYGGNAGRDLRGLVSPWMYGNAKSKRRKLEQNGNAHITPEPSAKPSMTEEWQAVNEWLLSTSIRDYPLAVEAIEDWAGPEDVDFGGYAEPGDLITRDSLSEVVFDYGRAALAAVYATSDVGQEALTGSCNILSRVAHLDCIRNSPPLHLDEEITPLNLDLVSFAGVSRASFLQNALLHPSNPLTSPTTSAIAFLDALLLSVRTLISFSHPISCRAGAEICLLGDEEIQLLEVRSILQNLKQTRKPSSDWQDTRHKLLWLKNWGKSFESVGGKSKNNAAHGLFWRIPLSTLEKEILQAMLSAQEYRLASDTYSISSGSSSLATEQVEAAVVESILGAYDNASNGNKTRGEIKKAATMLDIFSPHFPTSVQFRQLKALISATHSLSFYSLTLQHGIPFQPVSIRVHKDPLGLIEKVLEQNDKAYTQLDDLLKIGRDLVTAGFSPLPFEGSNLLHDLQSPMSEDDYVTANRRITSLAISSALDADDFDTAYSYVLTRLTPPSILSKPSSDVSKDNISWRAAYNAGRHRSTNNTKASNPSFHLQIQHLEQRMELLSLALLLAPHPENLSEILAVWRRCDEELIVLRSQENEAAESWDARGDNAGNALPGGFGLSDSELDARETERQRARRSRARNNASGLGGYEEAPMGLFDVARGAARAIGKNAFPLRGPTTATAPTTTATSPIGKIAVDDTPRRSTDSLGAFSGGESASSDVGSDTGRVRKRDMVSNMVTGGLASGIGWVLGAQPVNTNTNS